LGRMAGPEFGTLLPITLGGMAQALEEVRSPQLGIAFRECDLGLIVQEATAVAARGYPAVLVQVNTAQKLTALAIADALRTAVSILIDHACRYSDDGSDVTIKAQRVDAGITVLITERCSGPNQTSATTGRTPLPGRDLARRLVELHGGILWAESLPSGGNRVSFTIPHTPPALSGQELDRAIEALELLQQAQTSPRPTVPAAAEEWDWDALDGDEEDSPDLAAAVKDAAAAQAAEREAVEVAVLVELSEAPTDGYLTVVEPEASPRSSVGPAARPVEPVHTFIPDPLHPATSILRSLAEDHDAGRDGFLGL
jgi:hypothetical protein